MDCKGIALDLYSILDDIDTCSDIAKDDDKLYRRLVTRLANKRHEYATCDGNKVRFFETKTWLDSETELHHADGQTQVIYTASGKKIIVTRLE